MQKKIQEDLSFFKFIYLATSDILIPRAERIYAVRFCEAMAELGIPTELVSLGLKLLYDEPTRYYSLEKVYGIQHPFLITILPTFLNQNSGNFFYSCFRLFWYSIYPYYLILIHQPRIRNQYHVFYFQNYPVAFPLLLLRKLTNQRLLLIFEARMPPAKKWQTQLLRAMDAVVANTRTFADSLVSQVGLSAERVRGFQIGVNLKHIDAIRVSRQEAKMRTRIPLANRTVIYTGKVFKGNRVISYLIEVAQLLPEDILIVIVGGRSDQIDFFRRLVSEKGIQNIRFTGFVPPAEVCYYQFAADVLFMDSEDADRVITTASPGKLFEYMAAKVPIVAADFPCYKELLVDRVNSLLFDPYDAASGARAILEVLNNPQLAGNMVEHAYLEVRNYTWEKRAETVLELIYQGLARSSQEKDPLL